MLYVYFESIRIMFYVYIYNNIITSCTKYVFNVCLNISSMWELYLFEDIILTSCFEMCVFNYICVPRSVDSN